MSSQVRVKGKNGRIYVYEVESFWNKEKKKPDSHRKCIGHIDDQTGEIVPNRPRAKNGTGLQQVKTETPITVSKTGSHSIIDKAADQTGLLDCLQKVFPVRWPHIMTCCQFLATTGNPLYLIDRWSAHNETFLPDGIISQRVSELLSSLTLSEQQEFFRAWIAHNQTNEYFALDITSVSSYSELVSLVKYGYNRDHEPLPQINLLMITGQKSKLPVYFMPLDGKIKDVKALKAVLDNQKLITPKMLSLIMDKGFFSAANVDALYKGRFRFAVGVPFSSKLARDAVEKYRNTIENHHNVISISDDDVYGVTELQKWNGHRLYLHVYFDSDKAAGERKAFNRKLHRTYRALCAGETVEDEKFAEQYFIVKETKVRGRKVEYNEEEINNHMKNRVGWFVMASNFIKDTTEALTIYREKDSVEKSFDDLKNQMDMKRLRVHSEEAMNGRIFIQFLTLILTVWIRQKLSETKWADKYSYREIMSEISELKKISVEGKRKDLVFQTTNLQNQIIELFGL